MCSSLEDHSPLEKGRVVEGRTVEGRVVDGRLEGLQSPGGGSLLERDSRAGVETGEGSRSGAGTGEGSRSGVETGEGSRSGAGTGEGRWPELGPAGLGILQGKGAEVPV